MMHISIPRKAAEEGATVMIEGVVVVRRTVDGAVHVHEPTDHTTRRGLARGTVGARSAPVSEIAPQSTRVLVDVPESARR